MQYQNNIQQNNALSWLQKTWNGYLDKVAPEFNAAKNVSERIAELNKEYAIIQSYTSKNPVADSAEKLAKLTVFQEKLNETDYEATLTEFQNAKLAKTIDKIQTALQGKPPLLSTLDVLHELKNNVDNAIECHRIYQKEAIANSALNARKKLFEANIGIKRETNALKKGTTPEDFQKLLAQKERTEKLVDSIAIKMNDYTSTALHIDDNILISFQNQMKKACENYDQVTRIMAAFPGYKQASSLNYGRGEAALKFLDTTFTKLVDPEYARLYPKRETAENTVAALIFLFIKASKLQEVKELLAPCEDNILALGVTLGLLKQDSPLLNDNYAQKIEKIQQVEAHIVNLIENKMVYLCARKKNPHAFKQMLIEALNRNIALKERSKNASENETQQIAKESTILKKEIQRLIQST